MKHKLAHEPKAKVMSAADVWEDAQQIASVIQQNLLKVEPGLQIPLSIFLLALDNFSRDELVILHRRVEERLAV